MFVTDDSAAEPDMRAGDLTRFAAPDAAGLRPREGISMPSRQRKPPDDSSPPPDREPDDDELFEDEESLRLHEAYLEYRVVGGEPATPEAYRRAVEQFDRLPGVIRTRPGVGRTAPPRPPTPPGAGAQPGATRPAGDTPPDEEPHDDGPGGEA